MAKNDFGAPLRVKVDQRADADDPNIPQAGIANYSAAGASAEKRAAAALAEFDGIDLFDADTAVLSAALQRIWGN
jgi:hypothetical protein